MKRRDFVKAGLAAGATSLAGTPALHLDKDGPVQQHDFKLKYGPHFGMFEAHAGSDPVDQLEFAADVGFRAWEDNGMRGRSVEDQERIADAMERLGIEMGVFVAHSIDWGGPNFASGDPEARDQFLEEIRESIDVADRVNAKWMTVVPGRIDPGLEPEYQTANVVETLRQASRILEPHGLVMVLEPLNPWTDHPGMFLQRIPQAYQICKAVDSPSCKILFDMYHQQITEGNLIPNIHRAWDEVAYFQIGDNPGRNEPTTGEINYRNVFQVIHEKGFDGILGMEHGNAYPGREGEEHLINAYVYSDSFDEPLIE